ncbi:MAG: hypothetical protein PVSMB10_11640 [Pseudarthrobacter sp.]
MLSPERILGGRLEAGDKVTIYSSFDKADQQTGLLFHDVLITAVQKAPSDTKNNSGSSSATPAVAMPNGSAFITFARTDADASKLIYSAEFGKLWLAKQTDTTAKTTPPVTTFGGLYK